MIINGILWSFIRRWYGGLFDEHKCLGNRGIQTVVMITSIFLILIKQTPWWSALLLSIWIQFQFWSRAVGEILDCGRSSSQNAESYDRWFRIPLDWAYDTLGKEKYIGLYDWWYMWLRYTLLMSVPAIVLHNWRFVIIGLLSSPIYYGAWRIFDKYPKMWNGPAWLAQPKNLAEIIYGFVFGALIYQN